MSYNHTTATGFDFVDFIRDMSGSPIDMSDVISVDFKWNAPYDLGCISQLQLISTSGGFLEYTFTEGDGVWRDASLNFPDDFADYGSNPSLTDINIIKIRSNGDTSTSVTSGTFYIDQMIFVTSD